MLWCSSYLQVGVMKWLRTGCYVPQYLQLSQLLSIVLYIWPCLDMRYYIIRIRNFRSIATFKGLEEWLLWQFLITYVQYVGQLIIGLQVSLIASPFSVTTTLLIRGTYCTYCTYLLSLVPRRCSCMYPDQSMPSKLHVNIFPQQPAAQEGSQRFSKQRISWQTDTQLR